jgi:hypothetical protein
MMLILYSYFYHIFNVLDAVDGNDTKELSIIGPTLPAELIGIGVQPSTAISYEDSSTVPSSSSTAMTPHSVKKRQGTFKGKVTTTHYWDEESETKTPARTPTESQLLATAHSHVPLTPLDLAARKKIARLRTDPHGIFEPLVHILQSHSYLAATFRGLLKPPK